MRLLQFLKNEIRNFKSSCPITKRTSSSYPGEAAHNLYAAMHELEDKNFDLLIEEKFTESGIGISLNDRLYSAQETNFNFDYTNELLKLNKHKDIFLKRLQLFF